MKHDIKIIDAESKHLREMAGKLREDDRREIESAGISVNKALWQSFKGSLVCKAIFVDDELAAIFGVGGVLFGGIGVPWLLTSPACEKVSALTFARIYQEQVLKMAKMFPVLENYVHAEYGKAVKLLENIGFTVCESEEFGENKALFRKFRMKVA